MSARIRSYRFFPAVALVVAACADAPSPVGLAEPVHREALGSIDGKTLSLTGNAYALAATAHVGSVATAILPAQAAAGIGACQSLVARTNSVNTISLPGIVTSGTLTSTVTPVTSAGRLGLRSQTTISQVNLLAGTITANTIAARATVTYDSAQHRYIAGSTFSQFADLRIQGQRIADEVAPNTRIDLPGLGYVVLYERRSSASATDASVSVIMIRLVVTTANSLGVDVGTEVIVGRAAADAGLRPQPLLLSGGAYAAKVDGTVSLQPAVQVSPGCLGTDGVTLTRSTASVNLPGVLALEGLTSSARGLVRADTASVFTQSEIAEVDILGGLVRATGVRAAARVDRGTGATALDTDAEFATLTIGGQTIDVSQVAPNTQLPLAGVGTVWLKREVRVGNTAEVRMIEVTAEIDNPLLPIGVQVVVGTARASLAEQH